MRVISWNVAGRVRGLGNQVDALASRRPDLVALQEVTAKTSPLLQRELQRLGLHHVTDSFSLAKDRSALIGPRRYGQLIASRWPLNELPPEACPVPWPERVLSAVVASPWGGVEIHTTGIPPGCTNDWIKIEQLEGIYERLARPCHTHRILCGDFNTPQAESPDGTVMTWAQEQRPEGVALVGRRADRWDRGERNVITGLKRFDLADVFRRLHGYGVQEFSWHWRGKGRSVGRRFDHVFASESLVPTACQYLHALREAGLSDHSPVEVDFAPRAVATTDSLAGLDRHHQSRKRKATR